MNRTHPMSGHDETLPMRRLDAELMQASIGRNLFGDDTAPPPPVLGRFVVLDHIGSGGMGSVFAAYDPTLERRVAVKLIHPLAGGGGEDELLAEARALAKLAHPNVVAVHEAGVLDGRVFIAMEFVEGAQLAEWAKGKSAAAIVTMCIQAGRGLAAAHAEGIVHRDFKPANVLVGGDGRARVADFGLSRPSVADTPTDTPDPYSGSDPHRSALAGTPAYMAPEQFALSPATFASDQYSFCLTLLDLLRPDLRARTPAELTGLLEGGLGPKIADSGLPGWLRSVLERGTQKDPARRFPSMDAVVVTLTRGSARRRRGAWVVGVLAVAGGAVGAERLANARALAACEAEGDVIDTIWNDARAAEIGAGFRATGATGEETWSRVEERLDTYAKAWRSGSEQTCVEAELDGSRTAASREQADTCFGEARFQLEALLTYFEDLDSMTVRNAVRAVGSLPMVTSCTKPGGLRSSLPDADKPAALQARRHLADSSALRLLGRYEGALEAAQAFADAAAAIDHPPLVAEARITVAQAQRSLGHYDDAFASYEIAFYSAHELGLDELAFESAAWLLTTCAELQQDPAACEVWRRLGHSFRGKLGHERHVTSGILLNAEARLLHKQGDYAASLEVLREAIEVEEFNYGPEHPEPLGRRMNAGILLSRLERYAEAEAAYRGLLEPHARAYGPNHPATAGLLANLGNTLRVRGKMTESITLLEQSLAIRRATLPADHAYLAASLGNLGFALLDVGRPQESLGHFDEAIGILKKSYDPQHMRLLRQRRNRAEALRALGEADRAEAELRLALQAETTSADPRFFAKLRSDLGRVLVALGRPEEAVPILERALSLHVELGPAASVGTTRAYLAEALWSMPGQQERALEEARQARRELSKKPLKKTDELEIVDKVLSMGAGQ